MNQVTYEQNLAVAADKAWQVLADFGGFLKWAGSGSVETEGEGQGMIRHLDMEGVGKVSERADVIDHDNRILVYTLTQGQPIGMAKYQATVQLKASDTGCNISWLGEFDTIEEAAPDTVATALEEVYSNLSTALLTYVTT